MPKIKSSAKNWHIPSGQKLRLYFVVSRPTFKSTIRLILILVKSTNKWTGLDLTDRLTSPRQHRQSIHRWTNFQFYYQVVNIDVESRSYSIVYLQQLHLCHLSYLRLSNLYQGVNRWLDYWPPLPIHLGINEIYIFFCLFRVWFREISQAFS